jgi:hypothetical protein
LVLHDMFKAHDFELRLASVQQKTFGIAEEQALEDHSDKDESEDEGWEHTYDEECYHAIETEFEDDLLLTSVYDIAGQTIATNISIDRYEDIIQREIALDDQVPDKQEYESSTRRDEATVTRWKYAAVCMPSAWYRRNLTPRQVLVIVRETSAEASLASAGS